MRGSKTAGASAKRYLCEWRPQPTDRRASTLSETARAHPALESGTTRLAGSDPPLPSRLDLLPLAAAEIINTVAGRLALSAERPNHTNDLVSLSLIATERIARPHGIMPSDATLRWVAEGMTGGRRAVRRWTGPGGARCLEVLHYPCPRTYKHGESARNGFPAAGLLDAACRYHANQSVAPPDTGALGRAWSSSRYRVEHDTIEA